MPITLMPYIGFFKSVQSLDDARASRQRQDALKILKGLMSDPAVPYHISQAGWSGYEYTLGVYGMSACSNWQQKRGHRDNLAFQIHQILEGVPHDLDMPPWMGDLNIHRSHRSYLIRRLPEHYLPSWPNTPENMPILWPQLTDADSRGYRVRLSGVEEKALLDGERELPEWLRYDRNKREIIDLEEK